MGFVHALLHLTAFRPNTAQKMISGPPVIESRDQAWSFCVLLMHHKEAIKGNPCKEPLKGEKGRIYHEADADMLETRFFVGGLRAFCRSVLDFMKRWF